jgi:hypothetical protein
MTTKSDDGSDDLHQLIESRTGKDSLAGLTAAEADGILGELNHRSRFGVPAAPARKDPVEKPDGVSIGQQKKIIALMCELRKLDETPNPATIEKRVAGIIRRELNITATEKDPYAWLNYHHGCKLIEVIKGYLETAKRKAEVRGGVE